MLANFNSRERDATEWRSLFEAADPRFAFRGIIEPRGSMLALVEASWDDYE